MRPSQKFILAFTAFLTFAGINLTAADACTTYGCKAEFEEVFLDRSGEYFDLTKDTPNAIFNFSLVAKGGDAVLYNLDNTEKKRYSPSPDVTKFDPTKSIITSAELEIKFSDKDILSDFVDINAGIYDLNAAGSGNIFEGNLDLGIRKEIKKCGGQVKYDYIRQYDVISFDLIALGFGQALQDGKFVTMFLNPSSFGLNNDYRIEWASLEVDTACIPPAPPVPEPGTMMLLGFGMLGMAIYGKRRMNK